MNKFNKSGRKQNIIEIQFLWSKKGGMHNPI